VRSHYRAVFLSPHLDDAVFSCGGLIAKLAQSGEQVLIVNIFSEYGENSNRHEEESRVAEFLNVDIEYLGELDAVFRRKSYKSLLRIFSSIDSLDRIDLPRLADKLRQLLSAVSYDNIYVPLGVGWHVDHLLTHELGQLIGEKSKICYYEDAPYILLPHFTSHRLAQFGAKPIPNSPGAARAAGQVMMSSAPTQKFSRSPFRFLIGWIVTAWFWVLLQRQRRALISARKFEHELIEVEAQLARKIEACQLYKSQFSEFYLGRSDCESRLREYVRQIGGGDTYCERYWRHGQKPHGS
jgi:LmbE family N-acetylglucosaminyl deacetylase